MTRGGLQEALRVTGLAVLPAVSALIIGAAVLGREPAKASPDREEPPIELQAAASAKGHVYEPKDGPKTLFAWTSVHIVLTNKGKDAFPLKTGSTIAVKVNGLACSDAPLPEWLALKALVDKKHAILRSLADAGHIAKEASLADYWKKHDALLRLLNLPDKVEAIDIPANGEIAFDLTIKSPARHYRSIDETARRKPSDVDPEWLMQREVDPKPEDARCYVDLPVEARRLDVAITVLGPSEGEKGAERRPVVAEGKVQAEIQLETVMGFFETQ